MADKDEDVDRAIGALAESAPGPEAPEPPGKSPNTRSPKIERPAQKKNIGIGAEPTPDPDDPNARITTDSAFDTANEIMRRFSKFPVLGDIHGVIADVFPCDGTPYRSLGAVPFTDLIDPTMSPGDKLQQVVLERVHRKYAHNEKTYDIGFRWRTSGSWITKNKKLYLGSPQEIDRLSGVGEVPREPPPYRPPAPPAYAPQPGYGQAPPPQGGYAPPQAPSRNPEMDALTERMARTEGALNEVLGFLREERQALRAQAGLPPAPPAAPAPAAVPAPGVGGGIEDMVARGVVAAFKSLGVNPQAPPPSPNQPAPKDPLVGELESMATTIVREALGGVGKIIREQVRGGLAGVGAPPPDPPEPIEPPEPEPAEPIPPPPFHVSQVGSQWPDGRPVMYAQDADGNMDLKGVAFSNPVILEQGMRIADKLADGFKDMMSKVTLPNGNQVVGKTPKDAVDANPRGASPQNAAGVGEAPKSPNNPSHGGSPTSSGGGFPEG
jgi:hypothetical protein